MASQLVLQARSTASVKGGRPAEKFVYFDGPSAGQIICHLSHLFHVLNGVEGSSVSFATGAQGSRDSPSPTEHSQWHRSK